MNESVCKNEKNTFVTDGRCVVVHGTQNERIKNKNVLASTMFHNIVF